MTPTVIMQSLIALQDIEFGGKASSPANKEAVAALRAKVPANIMGHYDRLVAKGKKGCAGVVVKNRICLECRVSIPIGTIITVMKGSDIQLCGSCGRYLYIVEEKPAVADESAGAAAPKRRPRKKKTDDTPVPAAGHPQPFASNAA